MKHFTRLSTALLATVVCGSAAFAQADEFAKGFVAAQQSDFVEATSNLMPLAEQNHPRAQFLLGTMMHSGAGGVLDEQLAVSLYHKAAKAGVHEAQEYLAIAYQEGWFGLSKNAEKAQYWQQQADATNR